MGDVFLAFFVLVLLAAAAGLARSVIEERRDKHRAD
jgi:hypothetical protein